MFSQILLNKQNLIDNVLYLKNHTKGKLCVMVKANAYGHGDREVVGILNDYVECFGVSNQSEAFSIRDVTDKEIIVFGGCEDYFACMAKDVGFALLSFEHAKQIVEIYRHSGIKPKMHLCINSGMNRYGVRDVKECKKIIALLMKNNLTLDGIYTHFSSMTTDQDYTKRQKAIFVKMYNLLPDDWKCLVHVGGGRSVFEELTPDMHRVGLYVYGYGDENVKPVLSVKSHIVDLQEVKKGEHVGYLCGFTAQHDMTIATIPLGYGDGFPRKLSNILEVEIRGQKAKNVGNICMDAFMIDVSGIKCKKGDEVNILRNASVLAGQLDTTEYEVLTNLARFRGERKII